MVINKNETDEQRALREKKQARTIIGPTILANLLYLVIGYLVTAVIMFLLMGAYYLIRENILAAFIGEYSQGINPTVFAVITFILEALILYFFWKCADGAPIVSDAVNRSKLEFLSAKKYKTIQITHKIFAVIHGLLALALLIYSLKTGYETNFETIAQTAIYCSLSYPFVASLTLICLSLWCSIEDLPECPNCHLLCTVKIVDSKDTGSTISKEKLRGKYHFGGTEKNRHINPQGKWNAMGY